MQLPIGLMLISCLALCIKKSLDDVGTQHSACEATLQYQYQNIHFSLIYALFAVSSIDTRLLKKCVFYFKLITYSLH